MIKHYREGKISLGVLAQRLDRSLSETLDLLSEQGVEAPIEFEDYIRGFDGFEQAP